MAQGASPLKFFPKALAHSHALSAGPPNLYLSLIDAAQTKPSVSSWGFCLSQASKVLLDLYQLRDQSISGHLLTSVDTHKLLLAMQISGFSLRDSNVLGVQIILKTYSMLFYLTAKAGSGVGVWPVCSRTTHVCFKAPSKQVRMAT